MFVVVLLLLLTPPTLSAQTARAKPLTREQAQDVWRAATRELVGTMVHKWSCDSLQCYFQLDPEVWRRIPVDNKLDFVAGTGEAARVLRGVSWVQFTDMYTGRRLARYSAETRIARLTP
ncbi:hypothetical protein HRbin33_02625 [bacterium HR33]|nr:hypothetical protein HRbin33_02625 [bacterium HR33]